VHWQWTVHFDVHLLEKMAWLFCGAGRIILIKTEGRIVEHNPALELDANRVDKDAGLRNRWRWDWLDKKADNGKIVETFMKKLKALGHAVCILCNAELAYGNRGSVSLIKHASTSKHIKAVNAVKGNYRIQGCLHWLKVSSVFPPKL
jgi:hypothetical protein